MSKEERLSPSEGPGNVKYSCIAKLTVGRSGQNFNDVSEVISEVKPHIPVYLYRSGAVKKAATWFCNNFKDFQSSVNGAKYNGKTLFSVKSNSDERVIRDVFDSGVVNFDVASINEVRKVNALLGKEVKMYFMHPVKAKEVIAESYFKHDIRDFSFDSAEELDKIEMATKGAKDLSLHLRIKMSCESSAVDLSRKFGVDLLESRDLAKRARKMAKNFGVCFHVGSQCMDPEQYKFAIQRVYKFFEGLDIEIDSFDVGGGFPSVYPGMKTKPMSEYLNQIKDLGYKLVNWIVFLIFLESDNFPLPNKLLIQLINVFIRINKS